MVKTINQIRDNHITTDDLAFSAFLKMKGYRLIKSNNFKSKRNFVFENCGEELQKLQMDFINSDFLKFYNELRNLKKLI